MEDFEKEYQAVLETRNQLYKDIKALNIKIDIMETRRRLNREMENKENLKYLEELLTSSKAKAQSKPPESNQPKTQQSSGIFGWFSSTTEPIKPIEQDYILVKE
jgi:hypothetical protein